MSFSLVNSAIRGVARALPTYTRASLGLASKPVARSLWYMSHSTNSFINNHNRNGTCPCGTCGFHTKGTVSCAVLLIFYPSQHDCSYQATRSSLNSSVKRLPLRSRPVASFILLLPPIWKVLMSAPEALSWNSPRSSMKRRKDQIKWNEVYVRHYHHMSC